MRVLLCVTELEPGGAERTLVTLAERLLRERWEPVVCVLATEPQSPRDALVRRLHEANIPVYFLGTRGLWDLPRTLWRFRDLLRTLRPTLVQTFLFHATMVATLVAGPMGIPICTGIRVADRRSKGRLWLERFVTKRWVRRAVCVSRSVADFSIENGWPEKKVLVIPNSVEIPPIAERRFSRGDEPIRLTAVGRLTYQKGFDWLLEAFALWCREDSRRTGTLRIVGAGEEEATLRGMADRLRLQDRVVFTGWRPDVARILREQTDLFVLSSRWEGMANVVLEAMAQGLPILATDVEGVRELLDPTQIVPFGETTLWRDRCRALCEDPAQMDAMGRRNRARVAVDYSVDTMVQRYGELWETILREMKGERL